MAQRTVTSPNLMEFDDDSPRVAPPPALASPPTTAASATRSTSGGMYFSDLRLHDAAPPPPPQPIASEPSAPASSETLREPERVTLRFFVSCSGVDGNLVASSSTRTAQTFVRGALSMLAQTTSGAKTKSPRGKPPTEVNVEVRVSRELPAASGTSSSSQLPSETEMTGTGTTTTLGSESYWSERKKSRNPHFSVGFSVACQSPGAFDRHVQIVVMIPDEGQHSNKNSQVFGFAQTSFHEMITVATSGAFSQTLTLPVQSSVQDGATVVLRFVDVAPTLHALFRTHHGVFRTFLFASPASQRDDQPSVSSDGAIAAKLAVEEAAEVDMSVTIPLQLMTVCHVELSQMLEDWKARYNYNRKRSRHFEDDAEALDFGHDVYRVQVICARNLSSANGTSGGDGAAAASAGMRPSTFSIAGRGGIMNRLKTQAGKWGGPSTASGGNDATGGRGDGSGALNPFAVVKYSDGASGPQEYTVGRTNTEYETANPVWSSNKYATKCPHGKPTTKLFVSPSLPSRVDVSTVNTLKQFVFYRPSALQQLSSGSGSSSGELSGWLRFEVFNESYAYMTGVEHEFIGEVLLPLQSIRDAMTVESVVVPASSSSASGDALEGLASPRGTRQTVSSLTLVDWFDVRSPTTDECFGQIQLRINILLANPVASDLSDATAAAEPRTQRFAADCAPPAASNPLENDMPLEFLYPHVVTLQRQLAEVTDMIRVSASLLQQQQTFKSSQDKKRADVQSIPTNLHVSYFRIYRNFGPAAQRSRSLSSQRTRSVSSVARPAASTADLLGLGDATASLTADAEAIEVAPPRATLSLEERALLPETHATVTCGAPTAHAMGLSEYGLREMELEIHRLQGILDKCTPRIMTSSVSDSTVVPEDTVDYVFSAIPDDGDDSGDDAALDADVPTDRDAGAPSGVASPSNASAVAAKKAAPTKYSTMAARAVAGAKAATLRLPAKKPPKPKDQASGDELSSSGSGVKYPTLRTEAEDGIDPVTSINYAVRVLCRLEMLKTEYYLRKSVAVSQSVSGLVACFVAELDLCLQEQNAAVLEQMSKIGFLVGWESLISSHGKELRMLSDAWVAIKCLETFAFQLVESSALDIVLEKREHVGYTIRVPVPPLQFASLPESLRAGALIPVTSVLFTQGINEMQSLANMVGHSGVSIQSKINSTSFRSIVEYYNRFTSSGVALSETSVGSHPDEILRNLRASVEGESASAKNTCILLHAADAVRALHGGRVTYCKSGKDRTAMSVTLEQARLLVQRKRHVLEEIASGSAADGGPLDEVKRVANTMRAFGVRIAIAEKNVGRPKYSFNSIQRKLLPEIYRPPMSTIQDMVTSVTARDS